MKAQTVKESYYLLIEDMFEYFAYSCSSSHEISHYLTSVFVVPGEKRKHNACIISLYFCKRHMAEYASWTLIDRVGEEHDIFQVFEGLLICSEK